MPDKVPEVPGTRQVHFVRRVITGSVCKLEFCRQSCFKEKAIVFREQVYSMSDDDDHGN